MKKFISAFVLVFIVFADVVAQKNNFKKNEMALLIEEQFNFAAQ